MSIIGLRDENDHWYQSKRVNDFIHAYTIGLRETPAEIQRVTGYAVSEFLAGILPALLNLCVVQAAATTLGAAAGAVVGFGLGGVGAVPGAIEGAAVGFSLSATILGWLGLGFLFVAVGKGLGEMVARLSAAIRLTWSASDHPPEQRQDDVRRAGHMLAESMGLLMLLILQAIVAWLLKRGLDKLPELIAELRSSKLGAGFAEWVEKNAAKLYNDPSLRQHRGEGSTTKVAAESEAQSPSRLARKSEENPTRPVRRLVSPKEAEDLLASHGLSPDRAKDYVASFEGPITVREVSPGETFLRYTDVADSKGSFLTKQSFGSPQEASKALYLEPYGNGATLVQSVEATQNSMVLEGAIAHGVPPGTVQTLMMDRNAFAIGQGASFP